jgi:WD40 repeat protein
MSKTMGKKVIYLAILMMCCACSKHEKLLIGGAGWQQIAIVDKKSGEIEWKHSLESGEECNDVDMNKNGEILYAYKQGAKLIRRNGEVVWDYKAGENEEAYTASILNSGNYMIALCGTPARIVELDGKGETVKELKFNTATPDISRQFRRVRKTPQDTYLVPLMYKHKISEISAEGRYLRSVLCTGSPNSVELANDGNWIVSCGDTRLFLEINPDAKKIVKTVETTSLNWGALLHVSELVRYKNGNTLVANSRMESNDKSQPMLLEIDSTSHIVWRMPFNPGIEDVTTVRSFYE